MAYRGVTLAGAGMAAVLLAATSVHAQSARNAGGLRFADQSGAQFTLSALVQLDAAYTQLDVDQVDESTGVRTEDRRLRFALETSFTERVSFRSELDFANGDTRVEDLFVAFSEGRYTAILGHHRPPVSMDGLTEEEELPFLERAAFTEAFALDERVGASARYATGAWGVQVGFYGDNLNAADTRDPDVAADEGYVAAGRFFQTARLGDVFIHGGVSGRYRNSGADDPLQLIRYVGAPNSRAVDNAVATAPFVEKDTMVGVEGAARLGRLVLQGEYTRVDATTGSNFADDAAYAGAYAQARFALAGARPSYDSVNGVFTAVGPGRAPLGRGGLGALEGVARVDYLDLRDDESNAGGGEQFSVTAGVNWRPVEFLNFATEVTIADIDRSDGFSPLDTGDQDASATIIQSRIGLRY